MHKKKYRNIVRRSLAFGLAILLAAVVGSIYPTTPNAAAGPTVTPATVTVIASGLHNPRGLNFGPDGALYVVEAGGNGAAPGPCGVLAERQTRCFSNTGSITRIDLSTDVAERVIDSLPSLIASNGDATAATGIHDISFNGHGNAYVTMGFGGNPTLRSTYFGSDGNSFARLGRFNPSGHFWLNEDLGHYELSANPDGNAIDTNPYGVLALPGKVVYADSGGNALNQVSSHGTISTLAVFPDRFITRPDGSMVSVQAVPTTVALGPDGDYYVGELTGAPFTVGAANVYRVPAEGGNPVVAFSGFTNIIDIAFAPDGSLYVLEISKNGIPNFNPGRLVRIAPDGSRTEIAAGMLRAPGGIAIGHDGALYVTNRSVSSTIGELLRIDL